VTKESCSTHRRYQGTPERWLWDGGTELAATAVRVDPSELMSAVYTQTVQRSPWLNSRWPLAFSLGGCPSAAPGLADPG
jgi:hypothetical protein